MAGPTFASKNERERAAVLPYQCLVGETVLGPTGFTRRYASEYAAFTVPPLSRLLDYFGRWRHTRR
jgi:hypothetical protein